MTTSMPFRRANATTFDFDPKSIPATDIDDVVDVGDEEEDDDVL